MDTPTTVALHTPHSSNRHDSGCHGAGIRGLRDAKMIPGKTMRFRKLRIAWSVGWVVTASLLIVLWVRSLNYMNRVTWHYWMPNAVQLGTVPGQVHITTFVDRPIIPYPQNNPGYKVWTDSFENIRLYGGKMYWWFEASLKPTGVRLVIPDWFLIVLSATLATAPWIHCSKRFSLRTLLIATTLVAVVLGLAGYALRTR